MIGIARSWATRWGARAPLVDRFMLLALLVVAGAIGSVIAASRQGPDFGDEPTFLRLASNLVERGSYSLDGTTPTAWKPPLESWFLAPFVAVLSEADAVVPARFVGLSLYLVSIILFWAACQRLRRPGIGLLVAAAMSLSPAGLVVATSLYPQVLVGLLVAIAFYLSADVTAPVVTSALVGFLGGVAVLGHATSAIPLAVMIIAGVVRSDGPWNRIRVSAAAAIGLAVALVPWILRNALVVGSATIATGGGDNFLRGNNPNATARTGVAVDLSDVVDRPPGTGEVEASELFWRTGIEWISGHPADAARLYVDKLAYFFAASNDFASDVTSSPLQNLALSVAWFPFLLLAIIRVLRWKSWPLAPYERLALSSIVATAVVTALFFARVRYRVTVDPFVFLLAGSLVSLVVHSLAPRPRPLERTPRSTGRGAPLPVTQTRPT